MIDRNRPLPTTWWSMPFRVDVEENSCNLKCNYLKNIKLESDLSPLLSSRKTSAIGDMAKSLQKISKLTFRDDILRIKSRCLC